MQGLTNSCVYPNHLRGNEVHVIPRKFIESGIVCEMSAKNNIRRTLYNKLDDEKILQVFLCRCNYSNKGINFKPDPYNEAFMQWLLFPTHEEPNIR